MADGSTFHALYHLQQLQKQQRQPLLHVSATVLFIGGAAGPGWACADGGKWVCNRGWGGGRLRMGRWMANETGSNFGWGCGSVCS